MIAQLPRLAGRLDAACGLGRVDVTLASSGSRGEAELLCGRGSVRLGLRDPGEARLHVECPLGRTVLPDRPMGGASAGFDCRITASIGHVEVVAIGP